MNTSPARIGYTPTGEIDWLVADGDDTEVAAPEFVMPSDEELAEFAASHTSEEVDAELARLEAEGVAAFDAIAPLARAGDREQLDNAEALVETIEYVRGMQAARAYEQAESEERVAALGERLGVAEETEPEGGDEGGETTPPPPEGEPAPDGAEAEGERELELVAAAPRSRSVVRLPAAAIRAQQRPQAPAPSGRVSFGSTSIEDFGGDVLTLDQVGRRFYDSVARVNPDSGHPSAPVAQVRHAIPADLIITEASSRRDIERIFERAADPDRVGGAESLLAAGTGWCAPNQPLFDAFNIASTDGYVDLPTIGVERGGLDVPTWPSFANALTGTRTWTEANDVTAATQTVPGIPDLVKSVIRVPCPTWNSNRLIAQVTIVEHGNLAAMAIPEAVENFLRLAMAAHEHILNARRIFRMVNAATGIGAVELGTGGAGLGVFNGVMGASALGAERYRDKYRMGQDAVIEQLYPTWLRAAIREDIARRAGIEPMSIQNARIDGEFADRGIRIQWVRDWQSLVTALDSNGDGDATDAPDEIAAGTLATSWPTAVKGLQFAPGTFALAQKPMMELRGLRDRTQVLTNDYTALVFEEADMVVKVGHEAQTFTTTIKPNGWTGAPVAITAAGA